MTTKRLYRSRTDRMIAGVAGGMADYFGIDPTIVRLVWVLLLLPGGIPGLLPYLICWIVMPEEPVGAATAPGAEPPRPPRPGEATATPIPPAEPDPRVPTMPNATGTPTATPYTPPTGEQAKAESLPDVLPPEERTGQPEADRPRRDDV
jgi:phage shock protein PspC (stress-responsive transcriptional regulator)